MKTYFLFAIAFLALCSCSSNDEQLARKADRIHESILTVDTHCDTPMELYRSDFDLGQRHDEGCVDFPRMKEGGLDAEFLAVFIGQGPRDDSSYNAVHSRALEIFGAIHANLEKNRKLAGLATSYSEALSLKKEGRLSAFIGVENGYPIGKDLGRIKEYYDKGARYITLCHTKNNDICDSSTDQAGAEHNGLSEFGQEVVREMNRLGMMIDVSHISDSAFYDVLKSTNSPVIASHSSCRALCENPRNLSDNMLLALKENGGVIQICILSAYLKAPERNPELEAKLDTLRKKYGDYNNLDTEQRRQMRAEYRKLQKQYEKLATVKDAVDHIDHVIQVIGIDHVGIGTDFDGGGGIEGCKSVADMKNFTLELLKRGYSKSDIEKIWGGNVMRVLTKVEQASVLNP